METDYLGDIDVDGRIILLNQISNVLGCVLESSCSRQGSVADPCVHGNETFEFHKSQRIY
jgi:hypothetical protein